MSSNNINIRLDTKESERPVVNVRSLPMNSKKEDKFVIDDDNISEVSATRIGKRESSGNKSRHSETKPKRKEVNLHPSRMDNRFDIYSNSQKRNKQVQESEEDSEDDDSEDSSDTSNDDINESNEEDSDTSDSNSSVASISPKEIETKKQEYLLKLHDLENKGFRLTQNFTMKSDLDDLKLEYERHKKIAERDAAVNFSRKMLMACVTGLEYINGRFDPFNIKLDGWSGSMMETINEYDNVFARIAEKYAGKAEMAPELELMLSLAGSAFMFHLTKTMFAGAMPGMGDIIKQNPEIISNLAKATKQQQSMKPPNFDIASLMGGLMGGNNMSMGNMSTGNMSTGNIDTDGMPNPMEFPKMTRQTDVTGQFNVSRDGNGSPRPTISRTSEIVSDAQLDNDRFSEISSEYSVENKTIRIPPKRSKRKPKRVINI